MSETPGHDIDGASVAEDLQGPRDEGTTWVSFSDGPAPVEQSEVLECLAAIKSRIEGTEIEAEADENAEGQWFVRVRIPSGRDSRKLVLANRERLAALLEVPFERYRYITGYEAICSYSEQIIEASFRPAGASSFSWVRSTLSRESGRLGASAEARTVRVQTEREGRTEFVELGPPSKIAEVLINRPVARYVIRISGVPFETNNQAREILEARSDALFFQIDAQFGAPLMLHRERRRPAGQRRRPTPESVDVLEYPRQVYDREPMSLYWYGRSATGMPLLQFLAFYQVLEFYFPIYAQEEVRRSLRNIVKDPAFSPHAERDIGKLVKVLSGSGGNRGSWGDERSQLRATIAACVDAGSIRELAMGERFREHFKGKIKGLTDTTLRGESEDSELLARTAQRVYEIRCKIVHTKDESGLDDRGLLLPFSQEAEQLGPDIELVGMLARRVLAAASRPVSEA